MHWEVPWLKQRQWCCEHTAIHRGSDHIIQMRSDDLSWLSPKRYTEVQYIEGMLSLVTCTVSSVITIKIHHVSLTKSTLMKDIITMYFAMPFPENFDTDLALILYWPKKFCSRQENHSNSENHYELRFRFFYNFGIQTKLFKSSTTEGSQIQLMLGRHGLCPAENRITTRIFYNNVTRCWIYHGKLNIRIMMGKIPTCLPDPPCVAV